MMIFQAITNADIIPRFFSRTQMKLNYLIAFDNLRNQTGKLTSGYRGMIDHLYLESGGYGTRIKRAKVTLSKYLSFLKDHGHLFNQVFSLDDKHNDLEHNLRNLEYLEKNLHGTGIRPIPVIHHPPDHFKEIKRLAEKGYDYIAIATPKKIKDEVFEKTNKAFPQVKIHLLGKMDRHILINHRPHSVDASSWRKSADVWVIHYWEAQEKKEYRVYVGGQGNAKGSVVDYHHFPHKDRLEAFLASAFQYNYNHLLTSHEARSFVNLYFYKQLEDHLNGPTTQ